MYWPARPEVSTFRVEVNNTVSRMWAASLAIAGRATTRDGVGVPNIPCAIASRLGAPDASDALRQAVAVPIPSRIGTPRRDATRSPSGPSPPAAGFGLQSSGSAAVAGESASAMQSRRSWAGSRGQSLRSRQGAAIAAAAGNGGLKSTLDVSAKRPIGLGMASRSGSQISTERSETRLEPGTSTQPTAVGLPDMFVARPTTAWSSAVLTIGKGAVPPEAGSGSDVRSRCISGGAKRLVSAQA